MLSCVSLSPDRPRACAHTAFVSGGEKTQTQLNSDALLSKLVREAEEFAEGFSDSLSLITMLIKVFLLIVAEIVFLNAAHFFCASVWLITQLMAYWSALLWTQI